MSVTLYHGSNNKFTNLDYKKIGSSVGTSEGYGFYFTTDRERAARYGTIIYKGELKGLELSSTSISALGLALWEALVTLSDMENYAGMSKEGIIEGCDNDIDLMCELVNSGACSLEDALSVYAGCYVRSAKFDDEYVLFQPINIEVTS